MTRGDAGTGGTHVFFQFWHRLARHQVPCLVPSRTLGSLVGGAEIGSNAVVVGVGAFSVSINPPYSFH